MSPNFQVLNLSESLEEASMASTLVEFSHISQPPITADTTSSENSSSRPVPDSGMPETRVQAFRLAEHIEGSKLRLKIDLRLLPIIAVIASVTMLHSSLYAATAITSMREDLGMNSLIFSVSVFMYPAASVVFQFPMTFAVRLAGPRLYFTIISFAFGFITLLGGCVVTNWQHMLVVKVFLGITAAGVYPGVQSLIGCWYPRHEQQVRYAIKQTINLSMVGISGAVNFGLNNIDGKAGRKAWQWMFIVQGVFFLSLSLVTFWWVVDSPDRAEYSWRFLTFEEAEFARGRIRIDRNDVDTPPFELVNVLRDLGDFKLWLFAIMTMLLNFVSVALANFTPIILRDGLGWSGGLAIGLGQVPFLAGIIPTMFLALFADRLRIRGPVVAVGCLLMITGLSLLGYVSRPIIRYLGLIIATCGFTANWPALAAYSQNNVTGYWKRSCLTALLATFDGLGAIAGSFVIRPVEAPKFGTAVMVGILSQGVKIGIIICISLYFVWKNNLQARGSIIEKTEGFRYTI